MKKLLLIWAMIRQLFYPKQLIFTAWELSNVLYEGISKIEEHKYGITPTLFTNKVQKCACCGG